jgi:hypothetical protein
LRALCNARPKRGLTSELEEIIAHGDKVMVTVRTPGVDAFRARPADDRGYEVLTVRAGRIGALRSCHDRGEEVIGVS